MQFPILLHDECGLIMTVSAVAHDDLHKASFSCQPPGHQRIAYTSKQFHVVLREAQQLTKKLALICDNYVPKGTFIL